MAPLNPKVARAFKAMKEIGISEDKVKPVLKKLLKVYDKNWELIEEENYRVLADAIFDDEEAKVVERKKSKKADVEDFEDEVLTQDEPERPLKRLRLRGREVPSLSPSSGSPSVGESSLKKPKVEDDELPGTCKKQQQTVKSTRPILDNASTGMQPGSPQMVSARPVSPQMVSARPVSPQMVSARPVSPRPVSPQIVSTRPVSPQMVSTRPVSPQMISTRPVSPQTVSTRPVSPSPHSPRGPRPISPLHYPRNTGKQSVHSTHALIVPKDEPCTDGILDYEVPLAVIHPDSSNRVDTSTTGKVTPGTPDESSSLDIATLGEVKISLSYNANPGRSNFHLPSLDELRASMEEKCLRAYRITDPNFSVMKLMQEMCRCFLDLARNDTHDHMEENIVNVTDDCANSDNGNVKGLDLFNSRKLVVAPECQLKVDEYRIPRSLLAVGGDHDYMEAKIVSATDGCADGDKGEVKGSPLSNSSSLVVVPQCKLTTNILRSLHDSNDLTKGEEMVSIPWVNEVSIDFPPPFHYIRRSLVHKSASVNFRLSCIADENCCSTCYGDCLSSPMPCACACQNGGEFVYNSASLLKEDFLDECISLTHDPQHQCLLNCKECPLEKSKKEDILEPCKGHLKRKVIKECWCRCGCNKQCGNRVVQRGISYKLQVFYTPDGKEWGLRALEKLPRGAFVCEIVGEILTMPELYKRSSEKHTHPVMLDANWGSDEVLKETKALCLEATYYGNVARFINHRCLDANLIEIPVQIETSDQQYYHLALFTTREVDAQEELTWDYGIDFDDHDHHLKAFRCLCGSKFCRNMKRANRSKNGINGK